MSYISLFRKYRSEDFDDLVGQEHIVRTISNAIRSGKIGQGYLFCGTRGTGKTTVARIIAKALNCEHGPTEHPCGECHICKAIKEGSCMDVVEMDAASNRSVEDVEKIVDSVKYRPVECRYKVYIIDEAHQLSNQAKDAFLKTLEEPPEYVVFILATTEAHKIPVTIRSRCQQFDFKRGSIEDISGRIKFVAEKEGVAVTDEAVNLIARNANGSYRDSLSIFEQIISFSGNNITPAEVYNVLGLVEEDVLFRISKGILEGNIKEAFHFGSALLEKGKDIKEVLNNLSSFFRDLLAVKINAEDLGPHYKAEAKNYSEKQLMDIIGIFADAQKDLRLSDQQRLTFELAFMKAVQSLKVQSENVAVKQIIKEVIVEKPAESAPKPEKKPLRVIQDTKPETPEPETKTEAKKEPEQKRVIDFGNIKSYWPRLVEYIRIGLKNAQFATCLNAGVPTAYENGFLTVTFRYGNEFQMDICRNNQEYFEKILFMCYKSPIKVKFERFSPPPQVTEKEEEQVAPPPDFAPKSDYMEEAPAENVTQRDGDFDTINSATLENSSIRNFTQQESDLLTEEKKEQSDSVTAEPEKATDPLGDSRYDNHPKYEEVKSVFPDAEEILEDR